MTLQIQKFWDRQAHKYDLAESQFAPVYKDIIAKTGKYLRHSDNVLDYGCATGTKTIELADKVQHIHGLDISTEMIHLAIRKKDESKRLNISFSQGTIFDTTLEKASFDRIIAFGIIHLLGDKEKVIQRIHDLLKPGGLFISTTACMRDKMAIKTRLEVTTCIILNKLGIIPLHLNRFSSAELEKSIAGQNFEIIESKKIKDGIPAVFLVARKLPDDGHTQST